MLQRCTSPDPILLFRGAVCIHFLPRRYDSHIATVMHASFFSCILLIAFRRQYVIHVEFFLLKLKYLQFFIITYADYEIGRPNVYTPFFLVLRNTDFFLNEQFFFSRAHLFQSNVFA